MRYSNSVLLNNVLMNANIQSPKIDMNQIYKISIQAVVGTGTATGDLQIQVSNDICPNGLAPDNFTPTNWSDLHSAAAIVGSGNVLFSQQDTCFRWLRLVYTDGSSGAATAHLSASVMIQSF